MDVDVVVLVARSAAQGGPLGADVAGFRVGGEGGKRFRRFFLRRFCSCSSPAALRQLRHRFSS